MQREQPPALLSRRSEQDDRLRAVQSREGSQLQVAVIGFSGCFLALPPVGGKFTDDAPLADSEGALVPLYELKRVNEVGNEPLVTTTA